MEMGPSTGTRCMGPPPPGPPGVRPKKAAPEIQDRSLVVQPPPTKPGRRQCPTNRAGAAPTRRPSANLTHRRTSYCDGPKKGDGEGDRGRKDRGGTGSHAGDLTV